jgi:hypothetical protein
MAAPLMYVRFAFGVVGETRRTTHLVPAPEPDGQPVSVADYAGVLIALCGQSFAPGERELPAVLTGAPCTTCLLRSPGSDDPATTTLTTPTGPASASHANC